MSFGDELRKAVDNELIEPPKGSYKVKLDEGSAFTSRAGDEYAKVILEITEGEHQGERFQHFMGFANPVAKQINAEALAAYGVRLDALDSVTDLDIQLTDLVHKGTTAEVSVSYNDRGFMQIKVHGSRTAGVSDIPTDDGPEQKPAASFASAAGSQFGDEVPFD